MATTAGREFAVQVQKKPDRMLDAYLQQTQILQRDQELKEAKATREEAKQQRLAEQQKQERTARQTWVDQNVDVSKFAGVDYADSDILNRRLAGIHSKAAGLIAQNAPIEAVQAAITPDLQRAEAYKQKAKVIIAGYDRDLTRMGKSASVNYEAVRKDAIVGTLYNNDGTEVPDEKVTPKDVRAVMFSNPKAYVNYQPDGRINHGDLQAFAKAEAAKNIKDVTVNRSYAIKGNKKYTRDVSLSVMSAPGQEITWNLKKEFDPEAVDPATGKKGAYVERYDPDLVFKSDNVVIKDASGKDQQAQGLNDASYSYYFSGDGQKLALMAQTMEDFKDDNIDFTSLDGINKMKVSALKLVNDKANTGTQVSYKNLKDAYAIGSTAASPAQKEQTKKEDAYTKAKDTGFYKALQYGVTGAQLGSTDFPVDADGTYQRFDNYLTGGNLHSTRQPTASGGSATQAFASVSVDPPTGNIIVKGLSTDAAQTIPPEKKKHWYRKQASVNGVSIKHFNKMWEELYGDNDEDAKEITYDTLMKDKVDDFSKNGDVAVLKENFPNTILYFGKGDTGRVQFVDIKKVGKKYTLTYRTSSGEVADKEDMTQDKVTELFRNRSFIE